jgi:4-amino-4-deoxy-L-arabinose transferase-like glycosyltransferase
MSPNQEKGILASIVLAAFVLRALFIGHESLWPDEALYLYISKNLSLDPLALKDVHGEWFYQNPPLFMYLLSFLVRIDILQPQVLAQCLIVAMDIGIVFISFLIGKRLFGTPVGFISAALLAVNPLHWSMSSRILLDVPLTFFIYLALLALIANRHIAFYSLSFISVFTKYPAAPLFLLPLIRREWIQKHPRVWLLVYAGSLLVLILAIKYFSATQIGQLTYFATFLSFPDIREIWVESKYFLGIPVCFFFIIGCVTALRQLAFSPLLSWLLLFGTARLFLPWQAFRMPRYTLPLYPAIIIFAAYGGVVSFRFLKKNFPDRTKVLAAISTVFLLYVMSTSCNKAYRISYYTNKASVGFQAVQTFFHGSLRDAAVLTASPRQIKYMVPGLEVYDLPGNITPEQSENLIESNNIEYIVLDIWSPHQPKWVLNYFSPDKGYHPVFISENLLILTVSDRTGHLERPDKNR